MCDELTLELWPISTVDTTEVSMTKQCSLIIFLLLAVFTSLGRSQLTHPAVTTEETAQIVFVDPGRTIDTIRLVSRTRELIDKEYRRVYTEPSGIKTYFLTVNLGFGPNRFTVVTYLKDGTEISTIVTIRREQPDTTPGNAANVQAAPTNSPVATSQKSSFVEASPKAITTQSILTSVPVAYFGPNTGEAGPTASSASPNAIDVRLPLAENFVRAGSTAPLAPIPAPSPSEAQKAKDSEDKSIPINPKARLIFGFEQIGASSSTSKGRPFVDLFFNVPVGQLKVDYKHELKAGCVPKLKDDCRIPIRRYFANSFWTSFKLTSSPSQTLPDLGGLTAPAISGFFSSNQSGKVNDLVQAFEMKIGWETTVRKGFSLIAGVGATSPLTSEKSVVAYKIPRIVVAGVTVVQPDFKKIFGLPDENSGLNNLILTSGDRDRFMRNWFVGGRLRHQVFGKADEAYPAVFELTVGQDEVLTNKLIGGVLKFDSFVPIPIRGLKFLYFGASFTSKLTRKVNTTTFPFFLEPATDVNIFANTNFARNIRDIRELNSDRDGFSFRFGVDLIQLLNRGDKPPVAAMPAAPVRKPAF